MDESSFLQQLDIPGLYPRVGLEKPAELDTGRAVERPAFSEYNKKEFHHIYPTAYLRAGASRTAQSPSQYLHVAGR